jgi:phosphatidylglycerol:prolipoprotein diacylglycerol transferase
MRPVLFHVGGMSFHSYTVMFSLAFLVGTILTVRANFRRERPFPITTMAGVWAFAGGLLGAKVWWWAQYGEWADLKWGEFLLTSGLVFFGGLVGGVVAVVLYLRRVGAPVILVGDLALPYVALAHGIARTGCFLNGCCYGSHTTLPCGVYYPKSLPAASLPVHPVQLYETLGLLLLFAGLRLLYRRGPRTGTVMLAYLSGYGALRFVTEFFRGDSGHPLLGLTLSQAVASALLAAGLAGLLWFQAAPRPDIANTADSCAPPKSAEDDKAGGDP